MGMLRMRDWAGCVLFLLICSPPSAPRFPFPVLLCPALPACQPACLLWELGNFQVGRERDQFASGGLQVVGLPRSACAEAASQGFRWPPGQE